jgi:hypothetical protein
MRARVPPIIASRLSALISIKAAKAKAWQQSVIEGFHRNSAATITNKFQDASLRVGHTRQCVGFTLIHLLVLAAIHPPTTRRQGTQQSADRLFQ